MAKTKLSHSMAMLFGIALIPAVANAQFYQQDFSANFPPETDNPGRVTVIMTNESGDTIIPYNEYEIPGLWDYVGRHQVGARTGGADSNQEISTIQSDYTVGATSTTELYEVDPLPETFDNGNYPPEVGVFDDAFIALSEDGIGGIQSAVAWDQQYGEGYDSVTHSFLFRISGFGDPANDQADGMGWAYLNSENHGTTGAINPGTSEEPNYAGSFGIGFDIWDNGGEGGNSVSLHYDGTTLESRAIDEGTTNPDTGEDWQFNSFETDEIISAVVVITPGDRLDLNDAELIGGSPYAVWNRGGRESALTKSEPGDTTEGYLRVAEEASGVSNVVAFDHDGSEASSEYNISFNFRGLNENTNRADGMSFLLVPTEQYDTEGADLIDFGPHEEPNLAGSLGVGFDTFNSDADAQDDPEGMPNVGNHVSVHYDGVKESQENFDTADLDLVTDDPEVWHTADITINGDDLVVTIIDGADGSEHLAFAGSIDGLSDMGTVRPAFAARTGGSFDHYEIDNFLMQGAVDDLRGDFNGDGVLDASDIDALTTESASGNNDGAFDLNGDALVNSADVTEWIKADDIAKSWIGDANLDGEFNSGDLVVLFTAGKYETGEEAVWTTGDLNGDGVFGSGDLVAAFSDGGYELGPRAAVSAVPEPASATLLLLGALVCLRRRK